MSQEYPREFLRDCQSILSDEYDAFISSLSGSPEVSLRINPRRKGALEALKDVIRDKVTWEENGRYAVKGFKPGDDPIHFAGGYYMQEASAMVPAKVLSAKPTELVLDLCAAPGGKSGQIAADLKGKGALIANEPNEKRAAILAGNLERLGVTNALVVCEKPERLAEKWGSIFDAIMVDAPCSAEGMFRRDENSRGEWSPKRVLGCAERQREILSCAVRLLKPSGRLVYSTCTFNRHENEENCDWLADNFELTSLDFSVNGAGDSNKGRIKLWPHRVRGEGQFISLFKGKDCVAETDIRVSRADKAAIRALESLNETLGVNIGDIIDFDEPVLSGDYLYAVKSCFPDITGIRTKMYGVKLARMRNGLITPDHALAMTMSQEDMNSLEVNPTDAKAFMRGEELACSKKGWTLITHKGMPLGFGKASEGRMRNHLPKGLRVMINATK